MDISETERRSGLYLPWGWLSLTLAIITITALGTLAVIAKREGADTLSTIALALAVLSFSAQLIVTLAQAYNGTLQIAQADKVNADTRSSLAEIRATSDALLSNQRGQFTEVLRAALKTAVPAAVEDVSSTESSNNEGEEDLEGTSKDLEERLIERVGEALAISNFRDRFTDAPTEIKPKGSPTARKLASYPDEERGRELLEILRDLPSRAAASFGRNAVLIRDRANNGLASYIYVTGPTGKAHQELMERGLITMAKLRSNSAGLPRFRLALTDLGIEVASLFTPIKQAPTWLMDADL